MSLEKFSSLDHLRKKYGLDCGDCCYNESMGWCGKGHWRYAVLIYGMLGLILVRKKGGCEDRSIGKLG